jgi:hypothetical protein
LVLEPPLWKMMDWKSFGMMTFPRYWKIKFMFQTTNQQYFFTVATWPNQELHFKIYTCCTWNYNSNYHVVPTHHDSTSSAYRKISRISLNMMIYGIFY